MDMRGLAHFIRDVRKATSSPLEERQRVDLELVKIRSKFRDTATMSTYDRKKYVCKLMFIAMLGYPVEFGHMEGVKLLTLASPAEKLIGYLSVTVFLHENHPLLTLATHTIFRDLISENDFNSSLALSAIANAGGKHFAEVMSERVKDILLSGHRVLYLRKKAILTYLRIYRKSPEVVDLADIIPVVTELVLNSFFGMSSCAIAFLTGCINGENIHLFHSVPHYVIELLGRIILEKQTDAEYVYYGVPAPWLQAVSIRLLRKFPAPIADSPQREKAVVVLRKIVQATDKVLRDAQAQQKQKGTMNRVSVMNAVFFEVVSLVISWNVDAKLRTECLDVLSTFVTEKKDSNLRYLGFSLLARLCTMEESHEDFRVYCRQYQPHILVALHDLDVTIRTKALEVVMSMCDADSVRGDIENLLSYLPISEGVFKESLVLTIARLAEKYCPDHGWYVDTVVSVVAQAGSLIPQEIIYRLVQVVVNHSHVQKRAAMSLFSLLKGRKAVPDVFLRVAAIVLGEFGYQIALNPESTPLLQVTVLQRHLNEASEETQCLLLSTLVKFYNYYDINAREKILKILQAFKGSFNVELQQRATEYVGLIELGNDELLQRVLEPFPVIEEEDFLFTLNESSPEATSFPGPLSNSLKRGNAQGTATVGETSNGVISPQLLEPHGDLGSKLRCERDSNMESLFCITSAAQLRSMANKKRLTQRMLLSLLIRLSGVLYTNKSLELHCEQRYFGADAHLTLQVRRKTESELRGVSVEVIGVDAGLLLQSRTGHDDLVAARGGDGSGSSVLTVEFAARSLAPYKQPPALRLCYDDPYEQTTVMEVFSLPITTTRFLYPYEEEDGLTFETLCKQLGTASATTRYFSSGTLQKGAVEKTLTDIGFRLIKDTACGTECRAIAAHATQICGTLSYSPVVVNVITLGNGETEATVHATNAILCSAVADVLEQLLLNPEQDTIIDVGVDDCASTCFPGEKFYP